MDSKESDTKEHSLLHLNFGSVPQTQNSVLKRMHYPTINSKLCLTAGTEQSSEPKIPVSA